MKAKDLLASCYRVIFVLAVLYFGSVCVNPSPALGADPSSKSSKPIELILNSLFPAGSLQNTHLERWGEKLKAESDGRLTIRIYPGGVLCPPPEIYSVTAKGICDIGYGFKYRRAELFNPLDGFMAGTPGIPTTIRVYKDLYNEFKGYRAEFDKTRMLWFSCTGPSVLHTVKPVRTLEDLKGMQIRTTGVAGAKILSALGASPVELPTSELFIALQKGIVQGVVVPDDQLKTFRLGDVLHYTTQISLWQPPLNFTVMNSAKYKSLPPDLQKVIEDTIPWAEKDFLEMWKETDRAGRKYANSVGHEFITLTPEENAKWSAIIAKTQDEMAKEIDSKGYPGTKLLQFLRESIKRYSSYSN